MIDLLVWIAAVILRPTSITCPDGWHVTHADRTGRVTCRPAPTPGPRMDVWARPDGELRTWLACPPGAIPVRQTEARVACAPVIVRDGLVFPAAP